MERRTPDCKTVESRTLEFLTARGFCLLRYQPRPFLLSRILLPRRKTGKIPEPRETISTADGRAREIALMIMNYFSGGQAEYFSTAQIPDAWLDWGRLTANEQAVLSAVREIPYAATRSYQEIAAQAGFTGGARFAGNALAKNPFPVIIPCHRVIRADGRLGGFGGGARMKRYLLALEAGQGDSTPDVRHDRP